MASQPASAPDPAPAPSPAPDPAPAGTLARGSRLADFVVDHPWRALGLGLLMFLLALPGGRYIEADFTYRVWFSEDDPLLQQFDAFERRFGNDESLVVIMHSPSGIFDEPSAQLLHDLTDRLWHVPAVIRVDSLANYQWVHAAEDDLAIEPMIPPAAERTPALLAARREATLAHPTLPNWMVGADGQTTLLLATLKPGIDGPNDYDLIVAATQKLLDETRAADTRAGGDHQFFLTGQPSISSSFRVAAERDFQNLFPITFGLTVLLLIGIFRRATGVVLPLLVIFTSVGATMTLTGWLGMKINNLTVVVPQILLAVSVADSIHILASYYRALARGASKHEAARHTLTKNLVPTFVTSISTAFGFMSFATADVVPIADLGIIAAIGTMIAWIMTYLVMGAVMVLLPIKYRDARKAAADIDMSAPTARSRRLATWIFDNRRAVIVGFLVLTGASTALASQTDVNSDPLTYFPDDSEINEATRFIEEHLGGSIAIELVVDSKQEEGIKDPAFLRKVDELQRWIGERPYTRSTVSIVDILKSTNKSLHGDDPVAYALPATREAVAQEYLMYTMGLPQGMDLNDRVSLKNDALRLTANLDIHDSNSVLAAIDEMEARAAALGLDMHATGKIPIWQRMNPYIVRSFVVSLLIAVALMSLLLIVVFRSVGLGLLAMIPNIMPLLVAGGLLVVIGKTLDMGTVIVFSVCLGIAVDDTVHVLTAYNRLRREGLDARETVARIFTYTLPACVFTTIILVIGFGIFVFAAFVPNVFFGLMCAVVLSVALAADVFLLPALLMSRRARGA